MAGRYFNAMKRGEDKNAMSVIGAEVTIRSSQSLPITTLPTKFEVLYPSCRLAPGFTRRKKHGSFLDVGDSDKTCIQLNPIANSVTTYRA